MVKVFINFFQITVTGEQAMRKIYNSKSSFLQFEWKKRKFGSSSSHRIPPTAYKELYEIYSHLVTDMKEEASRYTNHLKNKDKNDGDFARLSKFKRKYYTTDTDSDDSYDNDYDPQIEFSFTNKKVKFEDCHVNENENQINYEIIDAVQPTIKKQNTNGLTKILDKNLNMESKRMILDEKLLEFEQKKADIELDRLNVEKEKLEIEKEKLELDKKKFEFEKEKLEFEKKKFELDEKKIILKKKELNLDSIFD